MLVLTRKPGTEIHIGKDITITVVSVNGTQVRIGIDAPKSVPILRPDAINKQPKDYAELHYLRG